MHVCIHVLLGGPESPKLRNHSYDSIVLILAEEDYCHLIPLPTHLCLWTVTNYKLNPKTTKSFNFIIGNFITIFPLFIF